MEKQKLTDEEIKSKYGEVIEITVGDNDEYKAYLKKPDRYMVGFFVSKVNVNPVVAAEELYKSCVISEISDKEILDDQDLFLSIISDLRSMIELKKSSSRKL